MAKLEAVVVLFALVVLSMVGWALWARHESQAQSPTDPATTAFEDAWAAHKEAQ